MDTIEQLKKEHEERENKYRDMKRPISVNLTFGDVLMIEEYEKETLKVTRSDSARDLIRLGYLIWKNLYKIQNPELAEQVKAEIEKSGIVDYIRTLPHREFDILTSIIKTELKSRGLRDQ